MNKFNKIIVNLRNIVKPVRGNATSAGGHHLKESESGKSLYDKYWNDGLPMYPERFIYRNNYTTGGYQTPKKEKLICEIAIGSFWCWVYWHLWHDWQHVTGHYYPPDPSSWTDEELGIPPDDVE